MVFYAVARGRKPGIYTSWDACKVNITGLSKGLFKSFKTREEAVDFCRDNGVDFCENENSNKALGKMEPREPSIPRVKIECVESSIIDMGTSSDSVPNTHNCDHNTFDFASFSQRLANLESTFKEKMQALEARIEALESIQLFKNCDEDLLEDSIDSGSSMPLPTLKRSASKSVSEDHVPKKKQKLAGDQPKVTVTSPEGVSYEFLANEEGFVQVYTDGACSHNGRGGAKAGVGVWFAPDHPLNISEPVLGRATNNMAEIQAATWALQQAIRVGVKKVVINTDSQFMINCITKWIKKWKKNGWRTTAGAVVNKDELIELDKYYNYPGFNIQWNYVPGHRGIEGNTAADALARNGAKKYRAGGSSTQHPWQTFFVS